MAIAGAMSEVKVPSFKPRPTEPAVPDPVSGLEVVIPVMVPPPVPLMGKIWLGLKLMLPLGAMDSPVAVGLAVPAPNKSARVADGDAVLLPVACVCHA